ncbi:MAG TPA: alpha,alpha-trehalase TreF [Steroidobacteraceae bacterium]|jgi:alpha,alpha-trehalase|nr:alpha,alpha-trehalase TreF [Steroidobacteraceae bacterium]
MSRSSRSRRCIWVSALCLLTAGVAASGTPRPPQAEFEDLFVAVQSAALFRDSKTFPDAVPLASPATILREYHAQRPRSLAALRLFVRRHFSVPDTTAAPAPPQGSIAPMPLSVHIDTLWSQLERRSATVPPYSSALPVPKPYVVPGGRFRELYYWDSYFTMLGLAQSGRRDLVQDMISDFAWLIDRYGHIPNGTRSYYLGRSQPPFFFEMVALSQPQDPAAAWARYLPQLRREYAYWMAGAAQLKGTDALRRVVRLPDGTVLNRYWDDVDRPRDESWREDTALARSSRRESKQVYRDIRAAAESGWDFSSRWLADPQSLASIETTQIVPVDLNSLLYGLEQAIRAGCERAGDQPCAADFTRRAAARHRAVDRYLWNPQRHIYSDYRWTDGQHTRVLSAATLYPLFESLASAVQAGQVAAVVHASLLGRGGLATTQLTTGQQWDAPNGWAPLQWIAVRGLRDSGAPELAATIACRWLVNVTTAYQHSGRLVEKYNVVTAGGGAGGEYPLQDGFGWTNGVTRRLLTLYPAYGGYATPDRCPDTYR